MHCSSEAAGFVRYFLGVLIMHMVLSQPFADRATIGLLNISGQLRLDHGENRARMTTPKTVLRT